MKCPWCNAEMKEGTLYCPTCGEEINMVPEFDPEIEDQCRETIESMTKDIFDKDSASKVSDNTAKNQKVSSNTGKARTANNNINSSSGRRIISDKNNKNVSETNKSNRAEREENRVEKKDNGKNNIRLIIIIILFFALLIAAVFIFLRVTSDSYKLTQAQKAYNAKEYDKALSLYELLVDKDKNNMILLEEYSEVLSAAGKNNQLEIVLYDIADSSLSTEIQREKAYEKLIYIYSGNKEYEKIKDLIISSRMPVIEEKYKDYLTSEPDILLPEGTYNSPQLLNLASSDVIYYSLVNEINGETVNLAENEKYKLPILLERGVYTLYTYTENKYGLKGDTKTAQFIIELIPPVAPELSLTSGEYSTPKLLEVYYNSDLLTVYYTTDGSEPTLTSQIYNGTIVVPSGVTTYSFVCVDEYDIFSQVVTVTYDIQYSYEIMPGTAMDLMLTYLLEKGTIIAYDGSMQDGGCIQMELVGFENNGENYCYVFEEALVTADGLSYLDVKYTVDMITGEIEKCE